MFKIQIAQNKASVKLRATQANQSSPQEWEGNPDLVDGFRYMLRNAYGAFGHLFDTEFATPIDLHYAVFSTLADFDPVVVEGAELVEAYDPGIPEGAVT